MAEPLLPIYSGDLQTWANALINELGYTFANIAGGQAGSVTINPADIIIGPDTTILPGSVAEAALADNAVTWAKVAPESIDTSKLADAAITTSKLASASVDIDALQALSVDASKLLPNSVTESSIVSGGVTSTKIRNAAVGAAAIGVAVIGTTHIANAAITNALIGDLAVSTGKIMDLAVNNAKVNDLDATKINAGYISASRLDVTKAYITGTAMIQNGVIISAHIGTAQITNSLMASASINSLQVIDGSITNAKIDTVAANKISSNYLSASVFSTSTAYITNTAQIANAVISTANIGNLQVTTATIGDLNVTTAKIGNYAATKGATTIPSDLSPITSASEVQITGATVTVNCETAYDTIRGIFKAQIALPVYLDTKGNPYTGGITIRVRLNNISGTILDQATFTLLGQSTLQSVLMGTSVWVHAPGAAGDVTFIVTYQLTITGYASFFLNGAIRMMKLDVWRRTK